MVRFKRIDYENFERKFDSKKKKGLDYIPIRLITSLRLQLINKIK